MPGEGGGRNGAGGGGVCVGGRWVAGGKILGEIEYYVSLVLSDGYE